MPSGNADGSSDAIRSHEVTPGHGSGGTEREGAPRRAIGRFVLHAALAVAVTLAASAAAYAFSLNSAAAALILHTSVLAIAAWRGFVAGVVSSLAATASFSFFLHPTGSWRIAEAANGIALVAFLIASTVASRLVSQARREAAVAEARRHELEALYAESAHAEALRESHHLKTALLRAVSHDLNTPLTAVSLELEALQRDLSGDPPRLARIAAVREDVALLHRRIDNLLAMGRLEAGLVTPHPEPVAPADLYRALREQMQIAAPDRPLALSVGDDCPDLDADPTLLLELVINLVDNAHRASPPGVPIEVCTRAAEGRVAIEVADRGSGLPLASRVPGEEVALHDLPSRGLGLEIARTFAAAMRGDLVLMNREGGGTVACAFIPAWAEPALPR